MIRFYFKRGRWHVTSDKFVTSKLGDEVDVPEELL